MEPISPKKFKIAPQPAEPTRLYDIGPTAELLSIKASTLKKFAYTGKIGCVRISRRCRKFRLEDIEKFIKDHLSPARDGNGDRSVSA